jgi:hypothetical protein
MKKAWLISAAAMLIAGAGPGSAQGTQGKDGAQAPGRTQSAPAEKIAPPTTTGQNQRSIPEGAQVPPGSSRAQDFKRVPETTGQGEKAPGTMPQTRDAAPPPAGGTTGQGAASTSSNLTGEQRAKITASIKQEHLAPVTNVNFTIAIGTAIPREIRRMPLPASAIDVYPAWRGYEFIMVGNDILIIDPATLRIVAIVEA